MCEELRLERYDNTPWGFRLTGGLDFGTPLSIIKVTGGSIAELSGVQAGDLVKTINGRPTKHFTHLDAQKCIAASGNYLTLTVLRGSVITPPVTPICGRTPVPESQEEFIDYSSPPTIMKSDAENEIMGYYKAKDMKDGLRSPVTVHQKTAQKATVTNSKHKYSVNEDGDLLLGDRALTEFEIAELLTSNEEVLDEGVLGINFKKFLPKVDFIRNSEVFKLLQNENTKKEISEQAQLQKEPSKRFSTFLMKPRGPSEDQKGLSFVKFKPPRYLPKPPEKKWELPKLKPWERPKREEPGHSVLWLFLEEKGEEIIDERWGTDEEERLNMSRNSYLEYEHSEISSSARGPEDDTCSITSRDQLDSRLSKTDDQAYKEEREHIETERTQSGEQKAGKFKIEAQIESIDYDIEDVKLEHTEHSSSNQELELASDSRTASRTSHLEMRNIPKVTVTSESSSSVQETARDTITSKLVSQLAEITNQIEALENEAPSELMTQLLEVKEQLLKLIRIQSSTISRKKEAHSSASKSSEKEEEVIKAEERNDDPVVEYNIARTPTGEIILRQSERSEERKIHGKSVKSESYHETSESHQSMSSVQQMESHKTSTSSREISETTEITEHMQQISEQHVEVSTYQAEGIQETEFQLCVAPQPAQQQQKKKIAHPITPQMRPIVLPGGRMWRKPKDAEHEDFYQGVLVAQAEVLIGSNEGVNFTKYVPPSVDMSTSEVYRLIHETEDKEATQDSLTNAEYCQPISKRHFYAATLREPPPIGVVELSEL